MREACGWDSGWSKQGQTVQMDAEPSTNAIGDDTAATGLTSCSPFSFIFSLQLRGLKVVSFYGYKIFHPDLLPGNSFSKDCLEFIQGEKETLLVPLTRSHYMTKFNFCIL